MLKIRISPIPTAKDPKGLSVAGVSLGWGRASAGESWVIPAPGCKNKYGGVGWWRDGVQNVAIFPISIKAPLWLRGWGRARGCPRSHAGAAAPLAPGLPGKQSPAAPNGGFSSLFSHPPRKPREEAAEPPAPSTVPGPRERLRGKRAAGSKTEGPLDRGSVSFPLPLFALFLK